MKEEIRNILEAISKGDITTKAAIIQIKNISTISNLPKRKASKLKIIVKDESQNLRLPAIPFWLLDLLIGMGLGLGTITLKFIKDIDDDTRLILESINSKDLRKIINELKRHGPFEMVDIKDGNNTTVKISIL